ncbi:MAG TPA: glycosyltransferase family 2 protein [Gammaproteobacteria bacterium]|nr:glycosyltransferase family 2 protein [Gammaproteobacteria bacterium]
MPGAAVSAITVNYNAGSLLRGLVESLLAEPGIARVVVVDNASRDASLDFPTLSDPRVTLICNRENLGFGAACNQGAAVAESEYLLFINPDCRLPAGALKRLTALLDVRHDAAMLGPLVLNVDGSEQRGCRRHLPDPRSALMRVLKLDQPDAAGRVAGFDLTGTALPPGPEPVEAISGACMIVRHQVFKELGGWDEGYFLHCEDLDLCMRLKRAGKSVLFVPDVSVTHVQGVSSRGRPLFVLWHKHRGMWRYYGKFQRSSSPAWLTVLVALGIATRFLMLAPGAMLSRLNSGT